jgi:4'-phosphopantetheinyl transferase
MEPPATELPAMELPAGEVHLWFGFHDECGDAALNARYLRLLSVHELDKLGRFVFARDRHRYLLSHALVRIVLSRYAAVRPEAWTFESDRFGRPHLVEPAVPETRSLCFNLTHTTGLIVFGVAKDAALGVDAEDMRRCARLELADRLFTPAEAQALHALPPELQQRRFFELWTLKESYVKARGLGLHIPLDRFQFALDREHGVAIEFHPDLCDSPACWRLWQLRPGSDHIVSICAGRAPPATSRLVCRKVVPLRWERLYELPPSRCSAPGNGSG